MLKVKTMISNRLGTGTLFLIVLFANFACGESRQQSARCDALSAPVDDPSALDRSLGDEVDHEVDYKALNSTFLKPEVARLYGIDQDEKLGVVMISVYETDALGVGVEACVSGGVTNLMGQVNTLEFDEIREGQAIYHIGTFQFDQEEHLTFNVDVAIPATGKKHELNWQQQFWRG